MKKFLLTLLVGFVGLISFSNAQFVENVYPGNCNSSDNKCSLDGFTNIQFGGNGTYYAYVQVKRGTSRKNINLRGSSSAGYCNGLGNSPTNINYSYIKSLVEGNGYSMDEVQGFFISAADTDCSTVAVNYKTSKMPISQLTPVITGISTVLGEFIPYVIYISLGVLIGTLGFVAIKRLMLRIYNKVKFIFKKR